MILAQEHARKKWCPMGRYTLGYDQTTADRQTPARNRWISREDQQLNPEPARCMMWRWAEEIGTKGYCGLGGEAR